jgi:uncharacterized repeat protein (TIGR04138 family)
MSPDNSCASGFETWRSAHTVLARWGIRKTDDFGALVYAMIERGELRGGSADRPEDFVGVYDFREAFEALVLS